MRMPAVVRPLAAVGDLPRANMPHHSDIRQEPLDGPMTPEPRQRLRLGLKKRIKRIISGVRMSERVEVDRSTHSQPRRHSGHEFQAPPFGDLGGTDRTAPDRGARLETAIDGPIPGQRSMNLDIAAPLTEPQTSRSPTIGQDRARHGLEREPLKTDLGRIPDGLKIPTKADPLARIRVYQPPSKSPLESKVPEISHI